MHIGILITGHPPSELTAGGAYDQYFARLLGRDNFTFSAHAVVDGEMPDDIRDADGWLITGSKHGAYEDHPWIAPLEAFIRACFAARVPMIGVCFGHQIIAQAMGGRVEKFGDGWSVGRTDYVIDGRSSAINAWHQDQVTALPPRARVIGASDFCANAALVYDDVFWTIQPHPEYQSDFIEGLIRYRGTGSVPEDRLAAARAALDRPVDSAPVAGIMRDFLLRERVS